VSPSTPGRVPGRTGATFASDTGLQVERTVLAWHRTATAVLVAAAAAARLLAPVVGGWAFPAATAAALCAFVMIATVRRTAFLRRPAADPITLRVVVPRPRWMAGIAVLICLAGLATAAAALGSFNG